MHLQSSYNSLPIELSFYLIIPAFIFKIKPAKSINLKPQFLIKIEKSFQKIAKLKFDILMFNVPKIHFSDVLFNRDKD